MKKGLSIFERGILSAGTIFCVFFAVANAQAQTLMPADRLEWAAPTTRTDGSTLPTEEIAGHKVYCGATIDAQTLIGEVAAPAVSVKLTALNWPAAIDGYYFCAVSTNNIYGSESDLSPSVIVLRKSGAFYKVPVPRRLRAFVH